MITRYISTLSHDTDVRVIIRMSESSYGGVRRRHAGGVPREGGGVVRGVTALGLVVGPHKSCGSYDSDIRVIILVLPVTRGAAAERRRGGGGPAAAAAAAQAELQRRLRLEQQRSQAPLPVLDDFRVNHTSVNHCFGFRSSTTLPVLDDFNDISC